MTLGELMTDEVLYLLPDDSAERAAQEMKRLDVGIIPVCDEERRLLGVVTDRDIVLRVVAEGREAATVTLDEIASADPIAGQRDWSAEDAAELMARYQIRRLPVVEEGRLVGIVSLGDLAVQSEQRAAGAALEEISKPAMPRAGALDADDATA